MQSIEKTLAMIFCSVCLYFMYNSELIQTCQQDGPIACRAIGNLWNTLVLNVSLSYTEVNEFYILKTWEFTIVVKHDLTSRKLSLYASLQKEPFQTCRPVYLVVAL